MTTDTTTELTAGEVMTRKFVAVAPEDTLGEVAEKLSAADAGSALVVDFGRLVGILTSRDVIHAIAERVHPSEARVRTWMSAEPRTVAPEIPADEAARAMLAGGFHHLPVTEEGRPVGMIGLRAVIGALRPWSPGF
jgi:CBS domain-containing protein